MKITNNGGGGYNVGSSEVPGTLLLALKPGDNDVDEKAWDKCKDMPAVKAAVASGRLVVGGNPGAPPSKHHIIVSEKSAREGRPTGSVPTPHDALIAKAAQEKTDFKAHPTMAMTEPEALKFIAECEDKAVLEACYAACELGKDTRLTVKVAIEARAAELGDDTGSDGDNDDDSDDNEQG